MLILFDAGVPADDLPVKRAGVQRFLDDPEPIRTYLARSFKLGAPA